MKRASSLLKPISIIPVSISVKMMLFGPECDLKTTIKTALATYEAGCIQTKRNRRYITTCPELSTGRRGGSLFRAANIDLPRFAGQKKDRPGRAVTVLGNQEGKIRSRTATAACIASPIGR